MWGATVHPPVSPSSSSENRRLNRAMMTIGTRKRTMSIVARGRRPQRRRGIARLTPGGTRTAVAVASLTSARNGLVEGVDVHLQAFARRRSFDDHPQRHIRLIVPGGVHKGGILGILLHHLHRLLVRQGPDLLLEVDNPVLGLILVIQPAHSGIP